MRPGQEAPDGSGEDWRYSPSIICFNEAGARSPGWTLTKSSLNAAVRLQ